MTDRDRNDLASDLPAPPSGGWLTAVESDFVADLAAVQADDALLDALGGADPAVADGRDGQELNALLLAWRRDIDSEPLAELVDIDTAVVTVKTAALAKRHAPRERRRRTLVPVAAAAAVLAIAFTGTGVAARDARPGDTLWSLTKVLYEDHARSIEAAAAVRGDLEKANVALAGGRIDEARQALADAEAALARVAVEDNRGQLLEQHRKLTAQLGNPGPAPVVAPSAQRPAVSRQSSSAKPPPPVTSTPLPGGTGSGTTTTTPSIPTSPSSSPVDSSTPPPPASTTPSATGEEPGSSSPQFESSDIEPPQGQGTP